MASAIYQPDNLCNCLTLQEWRGQPGGQRREENHFEDRFAKWGWLACDFCLFTESVFTKGCGQNPGDGRMARHPLVLLLDAVVL